MSTVMNGAMELKSCRDCKGGGQGGGASGGRLPQKG